MYNAPILVHTMIPLALTNVLDVRHDAYFGAPKINRWDIQCDGIPV